MALSVSPLIQQQKPHAKHPRKTKNKSIQSNELVLKHSSRALHLASMPRTRIKVLIL
jgi:hypothetical protein